MLHAVISMLSGIFIIPTENVALQAPVFDMSVLLLVEHIVALQTLVLRISVLLLVEHIVYRYL